MPTSNTSPILNQQCLPAHSPCHDAIRSQAPPAAPAATPGHLMRDAPDHTLTARSRGLSGHVNSHSHLHLRGGGLDTADKKRSPATGKGPQPGRDEPQLNKTGTSSGARGAVKEASIAKSPAEILRAQQTDIQEYRFRLTQEMGHRELPSRPAPPNLSPGRMGASPIREDASATSPISAVSSDLPTTSTGSNRTVRGTPSFVAKTPSYPFPRMATPSMNQSPLQHALSQQHHSPLFNSAGTQFGGPMTYDQIRSGSSTPASAMTFMPPGAAILPENPDFPTPSLYELSLMLAAEPGMDSWWDNVVQIMTEFYKAERVTLSVPADTTDIDNVPWGQKATYNTLQEDELSMGYLSRSMVASSASDQPEFSPQTDAFFWNERPARPSMQNRHSFTSYEDNRAPHREAPNAPSQRPSFVSRSKSYYPGEGNRNPSSPRQALKREALEEHDAVEDQQPVPPWEATLEPSREAKGRVLPVLQGLDLEADPLIDHTGVNKVIERGQVIALTRTYPYLDPEVEDHDQQHNNPRPTSSHELKKKSRKATGSDSSTKLSSLLANASAPRPKVHGRNPSITDRPKAPNQFSFIDDAPPRAPTPKFEEYEQAPPSPWSQSPAPSPAVRPEAAENPFFKDAVVDEESFNPGPSPQDYSATSIQAPETIGVDNSWTVLHVPLHHVLLSKPTQSFQKFKLDSTALAQRASGRGKLGSITPERPPSSDSTTKVRQAPIAILSILSPVIPYPPNLRHSLENLAPHLATSFSLCRHYTNLEMEVAGMNRKRGPTAGFGAVTVDGRPMATPAVLSQPNFTTFQDISQQSFGGSITSPSDYSTQSRSITASPMGTPLWDPGALGVPGERRAVGSSPGQTGGDSYFSTKAPKSGSTPAETSSGISSHRPRSAKEGVSSSGRPQRWSGGLRSYQQDMPSGLRAVESPSWTDAQVAEEAVSTATHKERSSTSNEAGEANDIFEEHPARQDRDGVSSLASHSGIRHTKLHSFGGDFATTLQSLPPSTHTFTRPTVQTPGQARPTSSSGTSFALPQPTNQLKGLMLDLLPVQVFVALPPNGEIVWVNSRFLAYRGQALADLVADPWSSLHPEDRNDYLQGWTQSLRTGEQFVHMVRLRRFDGAYRWHQSRAVASRDKRGTIVQFIGSYMDVHEQKVAELMAFRQQEIEASEAKHRQLANLIPQIIFTATENDGITFANEQWLSYTGQSDEDALGLGSGFMDFVHPDDLARCRLPGDRSIKALIAARSDLAFSESPASTIRRTSFSSPTSGRTTIVPTPNLPSAESFESDRIGTSARSDFRNADLSELAKKGVIKVTTDSNGRLSYTTELRLRSKDGEYRWHLVRCVEIDDAGFGSGASSYFGSATDINDHKLLEAKLKEAMESKGRFLSNMSHEIRTPLIGISGMVNFLQDTTLDEEQRDYANTIQTSANSLLMIINDILDLSKVDAGMMKLNFEWFHTRSLIEDVNELVSTMAIAKRLELNYIVEENVPSWVKGDKVRIRQVLLNVIGNAIKFTSEGEVFSRCRVSSETTTESNGHEIVLEYSVIDTGSGFTKEESELIFKPFSQIDGSSTRQHGGSGLGLVISRQLVELHGGKMEGSAVPGEGSTFTFTAKFGLPTPDDFPKVTKSPPTMGAMRMLSEEKAAPNKPILLQKTKEQSLTASPSSDLEIGSPAFASSASSDPSIRSARSLNTTRSSVSSVNVGLVHFSEAAKASGQDLTQMKLEMPTGKHSPRIGAVSEGKKLNAADRPPIYSILVICPRRYSREATTKHIEITLPKDVPHQITTIAAVSEARALIRGHESVPFTHVVLNLPSAEEIMSIMDQITTSSGGKTSILVLSDSVQRQAVLKLASDPAHQQLLEEKRVTFVYKPVKPSRFAVIFDPAYERDLSVDLNRSSAAEMVESQKQNYLDVEKRIGNKGFKVLLVEDNPVNQKVLNKFLDKVGIASEIAADGMEATEKVLAKPPKYYSLILCDLHMPRKDGYQTCREIRQWEKKSKHPPLPIIALSANVMSDAQEKCVAAGFDDYVTKPVDFGDLSTAMSKYFEVGKNTSARR
ncbi:hypothetical protein GGR56DRAFT_633510 [Xylariaceae sp. FL0804]|nr:hypothetical protein GGR56DRAFT_633510 [Xylariaceae sp. FL0804]